MSTACTDGATIYYNGEFIEKQTNDELVGLAIHEILHPLLDHLTRLRNQFASNARIANAAADYELNRFATQYNKSATHPIVLPKGVLLDEARFGTRSAESIFRELLEEAEQKQKEADDSGGGNDSNDSGDGSDSGNDSGDGSDSGNDSGDGSDSGNDSGDGSDSGNDSGDGSDSGNDSGDGGKDSNDSGKKSKQSATPPKSKSSGKSAAKPEQEKGPESWGEFKPSEDNAKSEEIQKKWRELLQSCIQTAKLRGETGTFLTELEELVQPPIDLTQLLSRYMDDFAMADDSTSPDRRHMAYHGVCVAGMEGVQHGTLVFVKDTSGSISQSVLEQCVSVIRQSCERLQFNRIVVMDADNDVRCVEEFSPYDDIPLKAVGYGGTDFRPAFKKVESDYPDAKAIVYMTDGYGPFPKYEPETPVLWLTWGLDGDEYPFGEVVDLKEIA